DAFVVRPDDEPDANGEQLNFRQRHLDVACYDEPFVEDAIKDVDQPTRPPVPAISQCRHSSSILRNKPTTNVVLDHNAEASQDWPISAMLMPSCQPRFLRGMLRCSHRSPTVRGRAP